MSVTIRCVDFGVYDIRQTGQRYTRPVRLERDGKDWQLLATTGAGARCWRFTTFAEAKTWLLSADGEAFLDALPRAEAGAR